jgi:serine/threonine-protein kinase RsbW
MADQSVTKKFAGRFENLAQIDEFTRQFASGCGFAPDAVYMIETAVDEACSNIIEHAYKGADIGEIECRLLANSAGLTITLIDRGKPFDPTLTSPPDINAPLEDRDTHGLGIFMFRKIMDEVNYRHMPDGANILTLVKRRG